MKHKTRIKVGPIFVPVVTFLSVVMFVQAVYASGGISLRPPFDGTYRVTAYFDHNRPTYCTGANGVITIYNGESVAANCSSQTGDPYPYDGHDGWDWSMSTGIDVLAAAAGRVVYSDVWGCYGHTIVIDHGNGYHTMYSHLSQRLVGETALVTAGQHIGESGNSVGPGCGAVGAHLHFGVRHGGWANTNYAIDPFGWRGTGRDPLFNHNGKVSTCLWRSRNEDSISCADTIVEDAGAGSVAFPSTNWQVSNRSNGYHMFYRSNTATQSDYHTWTTSAISIVSRLRVDRIQVSWRSRTC